MRKFVEMAREKCRQMDDSFMISNATQPTPRSPLREISARIRNMEMTARALRQDSGRALKSAKAKFSQGRSVKRVVRTVGKGVFVSRKHFISAAS